MSPFSNKITKKPIFPKEVFPSTKINETGTIQTLFSKQKCPQRLVSIPLSHFHASSFTPIHFELKFSEFVRFFFLMMTSFSQGEKKKLTMLQKIANSHFTFSVFWNSNQGIWGGFSGKMYFFLTLSKSRGGSVHLGQVFLIVVVENRQ